MGPLSRPSTRLAVSLFLRAKRPTSFATSLQGRVNTPMAPTQRRIRFTLTIPRQLVPLALVMAAVTMVWVSPARSDDSASTSQQVSTGSPATELMRLLGENDLDAAAGFVSQIDITREDLTPSVSMQTLAAIIQTARKCHSEGRREAAAEVYHTGAALCERLLTGSTEPDDSHNPLPPEKAVAVLNSAASSLTSAGRLADALRWLTVSAEHAATRVTIQSTGDKLLAVAAGGLDSDDVLTAGNAYRSAIDLFESHGQGEPFAGLATARLGHAWTLVMAAGESGNEDHLRQSLAAVDTFLQHHDDHTDAPSARMLRLSCQTRLGDPDAAEATREELVRLHPRSTATAEMIVQACADLDSSERDLSETLQEYMIEHHDFLLASHSCKANVEVVASGLMIAAVTGAPEAENAYATALSLCDSVGDTSTDILQRLHVGGHDAVVQRIAMRWLAARDESRHDPNSLVAKMQTQSGMLITGGVREAACRWAGRTGHWSMLAMAAEEEPGLYEPLAQDARKQQNNEEDAYRRGRSLHVERLFAEALLQTGKNSQSLKLWQRIVDEHGADDFPTLLRLAETAVAGGSVTEASKRIAAAQSAAMQHNSGGAGHASGDVAMTNLLAANLEIRQLRFDHGRALLERVVRSSLADSDLRGRAQWMIGETFFMQEKFPQAITAYRQVEAIGSNDTWTAASLVQAGKSFEQLGRTREAAVCYSTLVSRFGDSPHAGGARRRLAAMTSDGPSPPGTIRR